ncbi:acyl-CoA dehydrogenase family protein [Kiloniella laminariae]|uniref:acyl-CoA dehydrogenase family protein n=1 Tax=Kiloniella laminariae TaxID=454162 RepID=UPI00035EA2A3|nr:acyl-CoA dehydrogenase family protein [Kiloniella laminariae]
MDFRLPEEARVWAGKMREFVEHDLIPFEVEAELNGGELKPEIRQRQRQKAQDFKLSGMDAPKQYGGLELSVVEQVAIYEQLGRVTNALGWCFSEAHKWMFEACSEDQINRYVVPLLKGERHECYAITEAESGSDVDGLNATARLEDDHYVLNGEKWFVTSANLADFAVFQARLEGGDHAGAHVLFFVDLDSDGIEIIDTPLFSHTFEAHHPTYRFTDVRVPVSNRIGDEGSGMDFTRAWFRRERLMIAARSCGAAERLIEEAGAFAKSRLANGQPIAQYQLIQAMLADSATELWAARLMTYEAAQAHDRGEDLKRLHARCSMVKLYASEMVGRVADRCVQIFGGRGYMRENPAERFYREVRVDRIWEGTSEIQRLIIGGIFNKRGLDGLIGSTNP